MQQRGDVYRSYVSLPVRAGGEGGRRRKWVVLLQDITHEHFSTHTDVAFAVGSSVDYLSANLLRLYEVGVPVDRGLFIEDTIIDCRWVFTALRSEFQDADYQFHLPDDIMEDMDLALIVGLQIELKEDEDNWTEEPLV